MNVLKIGGGAGIDHASVLRNLARRVQAGEQWVLVHGCSDLANRLAAAAGIEAQTITSPGGHTSRYTHAGMIALFCEAAAAVNHQLISRLQQLGIVAAGFPSPGMIHAQRKTAIRALRNGRPIIIRDDYSGTITGVDAAQLSEILAAGQIPVIAPIALGEQGEALNVDGDLVAATIARALNADTMMILSNVPGLLRDVDDPNSLIPEIPFVQLERYETFANGRMKKKLLAAQTANTQRVILANARIDNPLDQALSGGGTHILREAMPV